MRGTSHDLNRLLEVKMKRPLIITILTMSLFGCDLVAEKKTCRSGTELYLVAFERELTAQGVETTRDKEERICFPSSKYIEGNRAMHRVDEYYRGAAVFIKSKGHEIRIREWLLKDERKYSEKQTENGFPFIVIYSGSKAQFENTKFTLNCWQYSDGCPLYFSNSSSKAVSHGRQKASFIPHYVFSLR